MLAGFSAYGELRRGVAVVVAAHDLPAGQLLVADDLTVVSLPPAVVPDGATGDVSSVIQRRLVLPMRRHEPLTDVRLLDSALLQRLGPGLRAVPVRFADQAAAQVVLAGSTIDIFGRSDAGTATGAVASGVVVLRVLAPDDQGVVLLIAADVAAASRLTTAMGTGALSVALRAPP